MRLVRRRGWSAAVAGATAVVLSLGFTPTAGAVGDMPADTEGSRHVPGQLLVRYTPATTAGERAEAESRAGASLRSTIDPLGVRVLTVPPARTDQALAALARNPHVDYVERDAVAQAAAIVPNDQYWSQQWGTVKTATSTAWETTTGSSSVVIAELDTGVDFAHPDLQGAFVAGYDFVNRDTNPADDNGHGTNVAGVLAARANNSIGIAGQCWKCSIMPVKVLSASGSGSYSDVASGLTWAADHGARIVNMSLGGASSSSTLANAVSYAANKGVLIVAAAGNAGTSSLNYPAAYEPTIAVAGSDAKDARYSWSSYGSWVEVAAPGCDYTTKLGGGYGSVCGTSFASPMTAGIAGLLASANPGASSATLRNALLSTADPVGSWVSSGRVNAARALTAVGGSTPPPSPNPSPATTTFSGNLTGKQTSRSYPVTTGGGSYSATLGFTRASSLTLTIRNAAGTTVAQASGGSPVTLTGTLSAGTYSFVVSGTERASFDLSVTYAGT